MDIPGRSPIQVRRQILPAVAVMLVTAAVVLTTLLTVGSGTVGGRAEARSAGLDRTEPGSAVWGRPVGSPQLPSVEPVDPPPVRVADPDRPMAPSTLVPPSIQRSTSSTGTTPPPTSSTIPATTTQPTTTQPTTTLSTTAPSSSGSTTTRPETTTSPPTTVPTTIAPTTPTTNVVTSSTTGPVGGRILRVTTGSGRATEIDSSSPIGPVSQHGVRLYCVISHVSHDDPIVHPGRSGAAHAHMFWGNTTTDHASTGTSLATTGNSSCEGGTNNRSSYWIPAVYDQDGQVVLPETVFVYYKSFGGPGFDRTTIQPIPVGLEMLASRRVANASDHHFRVGGASDHLELMIQFPECVRVDGAGRPVLSSPDNVAHLSYPGGGGPTGCPTTHPYRIPGLSYVVRFDLPFPSDWSLSSDHGPHPKGHSLHADYLAAWDPPSMAAITDCVVLARRNCGFAGGRGQLPERFTGPDGDPIYTSSVSLAPGADRTPFGATVPKMLG